MVGYPILQTPERGESRNGQKQASIGPKYPSDFA